MNYTPMCDKGQELRRQCHGFLIDAMGMQTPLWKHIEVCAQCRKAEGVA